MGTVHLNLDFSPLSAHFLWGDSQKPKAGDAVPPTKKGFAMENVFDQAAHLWDSNPHRRALAEAVVAAIGQEIPLTRRMQAMDFGAGTGLISFGLSQSLGRIYAMDPSAGMIAELRRKCAASGTDTIIPLHASTLTETGVPDGMDLAVCGMVLHHVRDIDEALQQLYRALKPGGFLAIADLMPDQGQFHEDATGVYHNGLDPAALSAQLRRAGFRPGAPRLIFEVQKDRGFPVFLLMAERP